MIQINLLRARLELHRNTWVAAANFRGHDKAAAARKASHIIIGQASGSKWVISPMSQGHGLA
jgi:hypothetical protein